MVKLTEMPAVGRGFISELEMPNFAEMAWTEPVLAGERRVAVVSTAGVSRRGDKPFSWLARDYRIISKTDRDLVMTHVAAEFDRTAWQQDVNTVIPLDRLEQMAAGGEIGSVANEHYAFMGAADPWDMQRHVDELVSRMKDDGVNTVFLIPV
jgi:D-proline reductase (dithiol) PrdB